MAAPGILTRRDFKRLTTMHLRAARALLRADQWQSAYHVTGYALECGLKACIARQTQRHQFPRRDARDLYTHDLGEFVRLADLTTPLGTDSQASPAFAANWATVKDWSPESRSDLSIDEKKARDLYRAAAGASSVMRWIRQRW